MTLTFTFVLLRLIFENVDFRTFAVLNDYGFGVSAFRFFARYDTSVFVEHNNVELNGIARFAFKQLDFDYRVLFDFVLLSAGNNNCVYQA